MPVNPQFDSAQQILTERLRWETKIRRYYQMRHDGLPRRDKTKPWQADLHSKTIDRAIRKSKPFWMGQLTAGDRLCNFTALKQQVQSQSDAAADYYDFITYQETDLIDEIDCAVDHMLLKGRGIIKSTVDPLNGYRIIDEAIDPMFLLMPKSANDFDDADEWIHVRQFTVASYRLLDARWDTSEETIQKIRGNADFQSLGIYKIEVELREGITHSSDSNEILVFEHWKRTRNGHTIYTYSPHAPDIQLRKPYGNPYKWRGKESVCFTSFQMESKEKGWYAPRGLGELLDVQEQKETYIENMWADGMRIANTRIFTSQKEIQNMANLRLDDGQFIGGGIESVNFSPPAVPYTEMLNYSKAVSEEIGQVPDAGITAADSKTGGKPITAAESNRIGALTQVGMGYSADLFRRRLAKLHRHRWGLICQFKERDYVYYSTGQLNTLPEQALHDSYLITPDGSPDGWNRQAKLQREVMLMNTFAQLPNSNPDYWVKRAMSAADGQAALQGFIPTGLKDQNEAEAQAMELLLLTAMPPYPAKVEPQQNQLVRIQTILQWLEAAHHLGKPMNPQAQQLIFQNLGQRMQILHQQNPAAHKAAAQLIQQMEQALAQAPAGASPQAQVQPQPMTQTA